MANKKSLANLKPFQPGQSGNPNGAPKGKRWRTIFREILEQDVIIPNSKDQQWKNFRKFLTQFEQRLGRKATNRDAIAFRQYISAIGGDTAAFRAIADREEGRPAIEADEPPGTEESPIEITKEDIPDLIKIARGEK